MSEEQHEATGNVAEPEIGGNDASDAAEQSVKSKRRRPRGGAGRRKKKPADEAETSTDESHEVEAVSQDGHSDAAAPSKNDAPMDQDAAASEEPESGEAAEAGPAKKKRRSSRSRSRRNAALRKAKEAQELAAANGEAADVLLEDSGLDTLAPAAGVASAPTATESAPEPEGEVKKPARNARAKKAPAETVKKTAEPAKKASAKDKRIMYVPVLPGEQLEVVLVKDGHVEEYYIEMLHQAKTKGNIYKGIVNNTDSSLQAAFVNYGEYKNGFLQIDEVHPEYYQCDFDPNKGYKFPLMQKAMKSGQEALVQVVKEPTGSKGAFLSTYLSLAGRYVVLTPGSSTIGVSRKVEDEDERARLKEIIDAVEMGEGVGAIVRTASIGQSKTAIHKDVKYLLRQWKDIRKRGLEEKAPALVFKEPDLAARAVRDYLTPDVAEIWVDDPKTYEIVKETAALIFPRRPNLVRLHEDPDKGLFERFNLGKQIERIYSRKVTLPSGGEIVFDQAEALMAVDINSGKTGGKTTFHETALRTNSEAAEAIAEQVRLRDIGGQIVIDFIEMRDPKHRAEVEKTLKAAMKLDRARHDIGKMSKFGLVEMVRQRLGSSALAVSTESCPVCQGSGRRWNMERQALLGLKDIHRLLRKHKEERDRGRANGVVKYTAPPELAFYLLNGKRAKLLEWETEFDVHIVIESA